MVPTLQDGDRLLVTTSLLAVTYQYGDIVIIQKGPSPEETHRQAGDRHRGPDGGH